MCQCSVVPPYGLPALAPPRVSQLVGHAAGLCQFLVENERSESATTSILGDDKRITVGLLPVPLALELGRTGPLDAIGNLVANHGEEFEPVSTVACGDEEVLPLRPIRSLDMT